MVFFFFFFFCFTESQNLAHLACMHLTVYKTRGEKRCEQEQHCGMLVKDNNKIPSGQTRRYWELAEFHYSGALLSNTGLGVLACASRALTSTDLASLDYASST